MTGLSPIVALTSMVMAGGDIQVLRDLGKAIFEERWKLLKCLWDARFDLKGMKVGVVLQSGLEYFGVLHNLWDDCVIIETQKSRFRKHATYVQTWRSEIAVVKFLVPGSFKELPFDAYKLQQRLSYFETRRKHLGELEAKLYWGKLDFLLYLQEGKQQGATPEVVLVLMGGKKYQGALERVSEERILLSLSKTSGVGQGKNVYLDLHPLMISAAQVVIGEQGWPYDPTAC